MISKEFYNGELISAADKTKAINFLKGKPPVEFYDVRGQERMDPGEPSYYNLKEVKKVYDLIVKVIETHPDLPLKEIGIISPYKRQVRRIKQHLEEKIPGSNDIFVGSVDSFQGSEKKVIVISTVRSNPPALGEGRVGFLSNKSRLVPK